VEGGALKSENEMQNKSVHPAAGNVQI
jgi:hypothetical protein